MVRLFFCLFTAPLALTADDFSAPAEWLKDPPQGPNGHSILPVIPEHEREVVALIHQRILESRSGAFESYSETISNTPHICKVVAIKGGSFLMGSPSSEKGRLEDEGPQRAVTVSDFWMGKHEISWGEFLAFAGWEEMPRRRLNGTLANPEKSKSFADWVSAPTEVNMLPDMDMGLDDDYPAIGMTQHAANKFCQWLSAKTGRFYRLPTEAEWEYACRAGTTGPYHCPTDKLSSFAVLDPDQTRIRYEKVGSKKPNPWGLHDMHGNVMEWCLDGYSPEAYSTLPDKDPVLMAAQRYPRVVRGGSWYDTVEYGRSAQRVYSHPDRNLQAHQIPQSSSWLVNAMWVGFRVIRPKEIPSEEEMFEIWNTGAMHLNEADKIPDFR